MINSLLFLQMSEDACPKIADISATDWAISCKFGEEDLASSRIWMQAFIVFAKDFCTPMRLVSTCLAACDMTPRNSLFTRGGSKTQLLGEA